MKKILIILLYCNALYANSIDSLNIFLARSNSMSANFTQQVINGKKITNTTGVLKIMRPNKFKWIYHDISQQIISDGKTIYLYDQELAQVIEKPLTQSIDKSPAQILAGNNNIKDKYIITDIGLLQNLQWVSLSAKNIKQNNGFSQIKIAFNLKGGLAQMKFQDTLGGVSIIKFTNVLLGVKFPIDEFKFVPPQGTDILLE